MCVNNAGWATERAEERRNTIGRKYSQNAPRCATRGAQPRVKETLANRGTFAWTPVGVDDWEISWGKKKKKKRKGSRSMTKLSSWKRSLGTPVALPSLWKPNLNLSRATIAVVGDTIPDGAVTRPTYDATMFDRSIWNGGKTGRSAIMSLCFARETCLESAKRVSQREVRPSTLENYRKNYSFVTGGSDDC